MLVTGRLSGGKIVFLQVTATTAFVASGILPEALAQTLGTCGKSAIVMAMTAIGLNTRLGELVKHGLKPIYLGLYCWAAVACMSLLIQYLIGIV